MQAPSMSQRDPNFHSTQYRADIDGLRAVAVSSVLIFHAFPSRLPGGFVGVDIFFVISGFLISGIIFQGLERANFSFVEFYSRRIRRIFPALLLVCAACLIFGWFSLMPDQFRQLGKHVVGGALFSSNFVLLNESGYFDIDSARKPLRHLWSLGIEEQYYLLWPALLFLCRKRASATISLLLGLALISFAFNLQLTATNRSMAYYLPLTRFWELMIGSGLAYWARVNMTAATRSGKRWQSISPQAASCLANLKSILGVAAILVSLAVINDRKPFPGWWALLVCAGAALVIAAGPQAWVNRRILGSRPFVWVGLISYPMYLWHWPLISFGDIMSNKPSVAYRAAALAATVALAWVTYSFVELPLRHGKAAPRMRRVTLRLAQAMAVLALIGGLVLTQAVSSASAQDPRIAAISAADADWDGIANETIPGIAGHSVLFFGDSHMEQYWPRVLLLSQQTNARRTIEFRTLGGCAPIPGVDRRNTKCAKFVADGFVRAAEPDVDIVVLAAQWSGLVRYNDYFRLGSPNRAPLDVLAPSNAWVFGEFSDSLAHLRRLGKRVVVLLSSPAGDSFDPKKMVDYRRVIPRAIQVIAVTRADLTSSFSAVDTRVRAAGERAGAEILEPMDWFCNGSLCPVQDSSGRPISKDGSHICASVVRARATALDQFVLLAPPRGATAIR